MPQPLVYEQQEGWRETGLASRFSAAQQEPGPAGAEGGLLRAVRSAPWPLRAGAA